MRSSFPNQGRRRALATLAAFAATPAFASGSYPDRPIYLIVPNAPGGPADNLARDLAQELGKRLQQTVVVENAPGASGVIAAQKVLRSPADGYTLLFGTTTEVVVTPIAIPTAGYTSRDFTPVAEVGVTQMTLVARPGLGISNADQLAALARQKPRALTVGTTGNASLQAFATMALQRAGGIELLPVPYKGGAIVMNDLLGGQLDLAVVALPGALPYVRSGKLRMIGILSDKRAPAAPDLPTINESRSFKEVAVEIWAGLVGPSHLPPAVVDRLSQAVKEVLADKAFSERRTRNGDMPVPYAPPAQFGSFILSEEERFRSLATGLKLQ
ncbi:MAG: tripartite tricarboxylate transporter substrate binding protein [Burkholderiales bacterium]|nr:tripartite tricarboxylate transporter substrate binding protein [Burkholderiales bacterium]